MCETRNRGMILIAIFVSLSLLTFNSSPQELVAVDFTVSNGNPITPHDFSDEFYISNGINPNRIIARRFIGDGWSVFDPPYDRYHNDVRVIATFPGYDMDGEIAFWYPLGEIAEMTFLSTKAGSRAKEIARQSPIYIFPDAMAGSFQAFAEYRQAAILVFDVFREPNLYTNPLGLRKIFVVTFSKKAFENGSAEIIEYMIKKNGRANDDMPILKSTEDIQLFLKYGLVTVEPVGQFRDGKTDGIYAIAPIIFDPTKGTIMKDAFLVSAMKGGAPLPSEELFVKQFKCLQSSGDWCW